MYSKNPFYSSDDEEDEEEDKCFLLLKSKESNNIFQFMTESTIHGLKYVGLTRNILGERFFWMMAVLAATFSSIFWIFQGVVKPLRANPVIMSFQAEELTIDKIPFPAFTICNTNKLRLNKLMDLLDKMATQMQDEQYNSNETFHNLTEKGKKAVRLLFNHCAISSSFSENFEIGNNESIEVLYHKYLTGYGLGAEKESETSKGIWRFIAPVYHQCDEMILWCLWDETVIPCSQIFFPIQTEFEQCCVFNMMPEYILRRNPTHASHRKYAKMNNHTKKVWERWKNSKNDAHIIQKLRAGNYNVPKRQTMAGMTAGLSILLNSQENEYWETCRVQDSTGFRGRVHSLIDNPHVADFGETIEANKETFFTVTGEVTIPDLDVFEYSINRRQCYLHEDFYLSAFKFYTQKNCYDECIMNKTIDQCNCVRYFMPRNEKDNIHLCHSKKEFKCLKELKKNFTAASMEFQCPQCLPECTQVRYMSKTYSLPLRDDVKLWGTNSNKELNLSWANDSLAIVHVYFSKDTIETKTRKSLYGYEEIIADAGGLLGLTLGISMISAVEPILYMLSKIFSRKKLKPMEPSLNCGKMKSHDVIHSTAKVIGTKKVKVVPFSPTKILVNPGDFMRWSDVYLKHSSLHSKFQ